MSSAAGLTRRETTLEELPAIAEIERGEPETIRLLTNLTDEFHGSRVAQLDAVGIRQFAFCGLSLGGMVAELRRTVTDPESPEPLREAVARLRSGTLPVRAASVSFDDGYADNAGGFDYAEDPYAATEGCGVFSSENTLAASTPRPVAMAPLSAIGPSNQSRSSWISAIAARSASVPKLNAR